MITYYCMSCEKDFEHELVFGDDIECPHCHSILSTDFDYCDVEGAMEPTAWVDGVVNTEAVLAAKMELLAEQCEDDIDIEQGSAIGEGEL